MPLSFDFATLRDGYSAGEVSPASVAAEVTARIRASGDDAVWISRVLDDALLKAAAEIERRAAAEGIATMPLYGLPFAVKDNIDVAGLPTTCACPQLVRKPARSAPVVERLQRAGALLVGKTNLDQFATGLVGVRSPYGIPRNPFDAAYIPGGSSSGSAVAVAAGLVAFALGTDTAGSGRVPASFNNIVGLKPTRGLISTRGVVPACPSLDCVSIFALTVPDAAAVLEVARAEAEEGCSARSAPVSFGAAIPSTGRFRLGVASPDQLDFFGNADGLALYTAAIDCLVALGAEPEQIDCEPFFEAAKLVYSGPRLAERFGAIAATIGSRWEIVHPTVRGIVTAADRTSGADVSAGLQRLAVLRQQTEPVWRDIDVLVLPTTGTIYQIAEIEAHPVTFNENLGRYTNFCNVLDLSALAVPTGFRSDGLPCGVTLFAPAFHDPLLAAIGGALHAACGLSLGASGLAHPTSAL
jgi:allophanate hydrolase